MTEHGPIPEDDLGAILTAGATAPSGGNAQAWRVKVRGRSLEIALDDPRSSALIDVGRSASMMAVGSFTENAAIAAEALGYRPRVELLGFSSIDAPLVRIALGARGAPPAEPPELYRAIADRITNRKPWNGVTVEDEHLAALREAVRAFGDGYDLHAVTAPDARAIAMALGEADVIRTFDRRFHDHMLSEMRWTPEEAASKRDGIDIETLEVSSGNLKGLKLMRHRAFVVLVVSRARIRRMTVDALAASSHLVAVSMPRRADPVELLTAGRALERAWLTATRRGLGVHPWCVLPFFTLRAEREPETLHEKDRATALSLDRTVAGAFGVPDDRRVIFTCRLSYAERPSKLALRLPWRSFTELAEEGHRAAHAAP